MQGSVSFARNPQGDQERALGLPISPLCDRNSSGVTKSQVGFFEVVVLPLLTNFTARFPAARPVLHSAVSNYRYWREQVRVRYSCYMVIRSGFSVTVYKKLSHAERTQLTEYRHSSANPNLSWP